MPRQSATAVENNFVKGLVTEATGLNFPENAAVDADNVVFDPRGALTRRFGIDFENNFTTEVIDEEGNSIVGYLWKNATGDGNYNIVVKQVGPTLHFYNTTGSLSLSAGLINDTVDLTDFSPVGAPAPDANECQFSAGLGFLFVVHPNLNPFYVTYDPDTDTFAEVEIPIAIRDTVGINEVGVLVDNRPATLTHVHKYNLLNQGWPNDKITAWDTARTDFPSNADMWWIFKDANDVFDVAQVANNSLQSTPAPKGFFRVSPWDTDRSAIALAQSGQTVTTGIVDEDSGFDRPSTVAFHAGRLFYAGVNARGYNSRIYFSQLIETVHEFGKCHSQYDPTSEFLNEFLPTDGGIIAIPDAGTIFALRPLGNYLIVFAANGVWAISGNQGLGFTATDFFISSIDSVRTISATSFVEINNTIAWWNSNSINLLTPNQQGNLAVQNLSAKTIDQFFLDIPAGSKRFARGCYNPRENLVTWFYSSENPSDVNEQYDFDRVLVFDVSSGAFYPWSVAPDSPVTLHGPIVIEGTVSVTSSDLVVDELGNQVQDDLGNDVVTFGFSETQANTVTKIICSYPDGSDTEFTFAEIFSTEYKDFVQYDDVGFDYESYAITGYKLRTQGQRRFQAPYIFLFSENEEATSFDFQTRWDYAITSDEGDWTNPQRVEHDGTDYAVVHRRLKIRGMGKSLQFKFSSVDGEPFNIIGWSTYETAQSKP